MDNFIITTVYLLIGIVLKRTRRFPSDTGNVLSLLNTLGATLVPVVMIAVGFLT